MFFTVRAASVHHATGLCVAVLLVLAVVPLFPQATPVWQTTLSTTSGVKNLWFSPDGRRIAASVAGADSLLYVLDAEDGTLLATCTIPPLAEDETSSYHFVFSPDGEFLFFGVFLKSYENNIRIKKWSVQQQRVDTAFTLSAWSHSGQSCHFAHTGMTLYSYPGTSWIGMGIGVFCSDFWSQSRSGTLHLINTTTNTVGNRYPTGELLFSHVSGTAPLQVYSSTFESSYSSEKGQYSTSGSETAVLNVASGKKWLWRERGAHFYRMAPGTTYLAAWYKGSQEDTLAFWDFQRNVIARRAVIPSAYRHWGFAGSPLHLFVPSAAGHTAGIWNLATATWEQLHNFPNTYSMALPPQAHVIATGTTDGKVILWKLPRFSATPVQADFTASDTIPQVEQTVRFANHSFPLQDQTRFFWDFGDGATSTEFQPSHIYRQPGTYNVRLVAWNLNEKADTIIKEQYITVPAVSDQILRRIRPDTLPVASVAYSGNGTTIGMANGRILAVMAIESDTTHRTWKNTARYVAPAPADSLLYAHSFADVSPIIQRIRLAYGHGKLHLSDSLPIALRTDTLAGAPPQFSSSLSYRERYTITASGSMIAFGTALSLFNNEPRAGEPLSQYTGMLALYDHLGNTMISSHSAGVPLRPTHVHCLSAGGQLATTEETPEGWKLFLRSLQTLQPVDSLPYAASLVRISPVNPDLLMCDSILWNRATGTQTITALRGARDYQFTADGRYILAIFDNAHTPAAIFDPATDQYVFQYSNHWTPPTCFALAPNGRQFATGATDGSVTLWAIPEEFQPDSIDTSTIDQPVPIVDVRVAPNPADNSGCSITCTLTAAADVAVTISDLSGRRVATLYEGLLGAGVHSFHWHADSNGGSATPGLYFCTVRTHTSGSTQPVVLLR